MSDLKFPDAAVIKNGKFIKNITADDLACIQDTDPKLFENEYNNNIYCPECHKAKLFLRNGTKRVPHFTEFKTSLHTDDCSLMCDKISAKKINEIYECNPKDNDIYNRLTKTISLFYKTEKPKANPLIIVEKREENNTVNNVNHTLKKQKIKRIALPRRLVTSLRSEDINLPKIFYGEVYIQWADSALKSSSKRHIRIYKNYDKEHRKFLGLCCSITITEKVYNNLSDKYKSDQHCYIAFFTIIEEITTKKGLTYRNSILKHSGYISIDTLEII